MNNAAITRRFELAGAMHDYRRLAATAAVIVIVAAAALIDDIHTAIASVLANAAAIVETHPVAGPVLFVVLAAISAVAMFFSSALIVPVAVYAWGRPLTALFLGAGWLAGGMLTYVIGRYPGRKLVQWFAPSAHLKRYEAVLSERSSFPLVLAFQFAVPSEIPGYVLGSLRYPFLRYVVVLMLSEIPWAIGAVYFGQSFVNRDFRSLLLIGGAGLAFTVAAFLHFRSRLARQQPGTTR